VPTFSQTDRFRRDFAKLTAEQKAAFRAAAARFVDDLPSEGFHPGIRIRGVQGADGVFEMTWADHGRATFEYGTAEDGSVVREGETHIVWRRIGTHEILAGS
jgi:hypothetical protein